MRRLCRQNVEASLLDDAEVQPTFAFSVCKNIAFFPDRTKNPIERFYGAIDEIYTTAWVAFSESISLGTESFISLTSTSSSVWRIKFLLVSSTTWRVGQGMAKERTSSFWASPSCRTASSGMKVTPLPLSTMRIKVSMLPRW